MCILYCLLMLFMSFFFVCVCVCCFFFQAEDGIRYLVRSRGLGDVYKRQPQNRRATTPSLRHDRRTIWQANASLERMKVEAAVGGDPSDGDQAR